SMPRSSPDPHKEQSSFRRPAIRGAAWWLALPRKLRTSHYIPEIRIRTSRQKSSGEEHFQIFHVERSNQARIGVQNRICQFTLALLQLGNFFLDRVLCQQPVGEHMPRLADPVRTIDGL